MNIETKTRKLIRSLIASAVFATLFGSGAGFLTVHFLGGDDPMVGASVFLEYQGGTSESTYRKGDILYASDTNTLSKLASGSEDQVLKISSGVPAWGTDAGGSGTLKTEEDGIQNLVAASILNFENHFTLTASGSTESRVVIKNDSLNWAEIIDAMTLDANLTVASGAFNIGWGATDFLNIGNASVSKKFEVGLDDFTVDPNGADGASVSIPFEFTSYVSVSNAFSVGSSNFSVSGATGNTIILGTLNVTGLSTLGAVTATGVIDFGGATSLETPNGAGGTTVNAAGEVTVDTSSASFNFYDGTAERVLPSERCFAYYIESPTATNPLSIGHKRFFDAFTITKVSSTASGSNSVGWNLRYGAPGTVTTNVFTTPKSASTSTSPIYTSFANSAISDGNVLDVRITSASATLQSFTVNVCGRTNP